ncbi:MAG TPA: helix-turn-helix domain-containing protein [Trinickia sp.]|nr:helix-turn-helix domain-containing protein [Trinickia sp.]
MSYFAALSFDRRCATKYDFYKLSYFAAMHTLSEIAGFLRDRLKKTGITQRALGDRSGLARRTLTGVLSGEADFKVTTLVAVLDCLGYELAFVPKGAAAGMAADTAFAPTKPAVKTRVQSAREKLQRDSDEQ